MLLVQTALSVFPPEPFLRRNLIGFLRQYGVKMNKTFINTFVIGPQLEKAVKSPAKRCAIVYPVTALQASCKLEYCLSLMGDCRL